MIELSFVQTWVTMKLAASLVVLTLLVALGWANIDLRTGFEILQRCYKASNVSDRMLSKSKELIQNYVRNIRPGDKSEYSIFSPAKAPWRINPDKDTNNTFLKQAMPMKPNCNGTSGLSFKQLAKKTSSRP